VIVRNFGRTWIRRNNRPLGVSKPAKMYNTNIAPHRGIQVVGTDGTPANVLLDREEDHTDSRFCRAVGFHPETRYHAA
jgi:hypothetical protein